MEQYRFQSPPLFCYMTGGLKRFLKRPTSVEGGSILACIWDEGPPRLSQSWPVWYDEFYIYLGVPYPSLYTLEERVYMVNTLMCLG